MGEISGLFYSLDPLAGRYYPDAVNLNGWNFSVCAVKAAELREKPI
jgi:hypothetical protein